MSISWAQVSITWLKRTDKLIYITSLTGEMHMHVEKYEQEGAKIEENGVENRLFEPIPIK